jgi:hypothetical protein
MIAKALGAGLLFVSACIVGYAAVASAWLVERTLTDPALMYEASSFFATGDGPPMTEEESEALGAQFDCLLKSSAMKLPWLCSVHGEPDGEAVTAAIKLQMFIEWPLRRLGQAEVFGWIISEINTRAFVELEKREAETLSAKR